MRIFAKRFYGFDPLTRPVVAFGKEGNRDALITASSPGDLIVYVGTQGEPTVEAERGRLLGIAEFARVAVDARDLIDPATLRPFDLNPDGSLAWPKGLPILRAWRFQEPRLKLLDILREQLTYEATVRAVELDEVDTRAVLALPREEAVVPAHPVIERLTRLNDALGHGRPTTGPVPVIWTGVVSRDVGSEAWTYAMRFGRRNVWKVGHAQDTAVRLAQLNLHVPYEELGEKWELKLRQRWPDSVQAYAMEQRVFGSMTTYRTEGERLRCTEAQMQAGWTAALVA
ncbi:hypothetical protein LPLAFNJD_LOCUS1946 [Methylorubrum aminovorans]